MKPDEEKVKELLILAGFDENYKPWKETDDERIKLYEIKEEQAKKDAAPEFPFDIVLLDLLMPGSKRSQATHQYVGEPIDYGFPLMFLAVSNGAKMVGILTDMGHHDHPLSAALDSPFPLEKTFVLNNAKITICRGLSIELVHENTPCPHCDNGKGTSMSGGQYTCGYCKGTNQEHVYAKDWGKMIDILLGKKVGPEEPEESAITSGA